MASFSREILNIRKIINYWEKKQLILQPKFQRRVAWDEDARSYLIDTVVRKFPMPKIYLRRTVNPDTRLMIYEVVDGQQRLDAIISFYKGNLLLKAKHNPNFNDVTFSNLPDTVQQDFFEYEISTEMIENASDPEVWGLFERLNTYTMTLNRQEKLNAKYFGFFKQTAYKLAAEEEALDAWKKLNVFRDMQIARMKEVEMTSDVLVAIVWGISNLSDIRKAYIEYDNEFPYMESAMSTFRVTLDFIREHLCEVVKSTRFRRLAWFYSLMVATADALVGIPGGDGPKKLQSGEIICRRMGAIHEVLKQEEIPLGLVDLHSTLSRATSHTRERRIRHNHFSNMLTLPVSVWRTHWTNIMANQTNQ